MIDFRRWERTWQINEDRIGVLDGLKDLRFGLRRKSPPGEEPAKFDFLHVPDDPLNDPFEKTTFTQFGRVLPSAPFSKLKPWKSAERTKYEKMLKETFGGAHTDVLRLEGEKVVSEQTEWLTLFLLPEAVSKFGNGPPYIDLMMVACRTTLGVKFGKLRALRNPRTRQDGTAHGNPK